MSGEIIAHYRLLATPGKIGIGVIYKAEDTGLRRAVAFKFLSTHLASEGQASSRFLREAQAALTQRNTCTI